MKDERYRRPAGLLVGGVVFAVFAAIGLATGIWETEVGHQLGAYGLGGLTAGASTVAYVMGLLFLFLSGFCLIEWRAE